MVDGAQAAEVLQTKFADAIAGSGSFQDQHWVVIPCERLLEVAAFLRDDPAMAFDYLVDVTAVHWPDRAEPFELVYHLYSYGRNDRLRIKTPLHEGQRPPSLAGIWKSADWNERETYDMFGIEFDGHPDLRRILMPDDYTDYPLRKEFPLYRG